MDLISAPGVADLLGIGVTRVYELHKRNTDGFAELKLEVPDPSLWVYSERDVRAWATKTGRLDEQGNAIKRRPGRRSSTAPH